MKPKPMATATTKAKAYKYNLNSNKVIKGNFRMTKLTLTHTHSPFEYITKHSTNGKEVQAHSSFMSFNSFSVLYSVFIAIVCSREELVTSTSSVQYFIVIDIGFVVIIISFGPSFLVALHLRRTHTHGHRHGHRHGHHGLNTFRHRMTCNTFARQNIPSLVRCSRKVFDSKPKCRQIEGKREREAWGVKEHVECCCA